VSYLFVYGTLTPGHAPACVADLVARFSVVGPATVHGTLHDFTAYPGLVLGGTGSVQGTLVRVPAEHGDTLWRRLDAYEGFDPADPQGSLFRRVAATATLADGRVVDCQTYVFGQTPTRAPVIPGGNWFTRMQPSQQRAPATARRPRIGITTGSPDKDPSRYQLPSDYARSVERAGGLPMLLPFRMDLSLVPEVVDSVDGLLFIGGNDLDPSLYGQPLHPKAVPLDSDRQRFELALLAEAERRRVPVLGVCLGSQLLNVHRGGSLIQFLPDQPREPAIEHRDRGDGGFRHGVAIEPGTVLHQAIGQTDIQVNSRHKQAVDRLGRGLRAVAFAPDGTIEAIEDPSMPLFLGVQWHPENLAGEHAEHLAPFRLLVEKAKERA
jgi:putative glutamine amidotransferase